MNHVWVHVWPVVDADIDQLPPCRPRSPRSTDGAGIEEVTAHGRVLGPDGTPQRLVVRFHAPLGSGTVTTIEAPPTERLKPLDDYAARCSGPAGAGWSTPTS